jgi:hypothetical protein
MRDSKEVILMMVGNVNKGGKGQFGYTYYEQGLAPTIAAGTHGYCIGHILVDESKDNKHIQSEQQPT